MWLKLLFHLVIFLAICLPILLRIYKESFTRRLTLSSTATFLKFGPWNPLSSISTLPFIHCSEFHFKKNYLPSDSHTNTVVSGACCLPVKMASKSVIGSIESLFTRLLTHSLHNAVRQNATCIYLLATLQSKNDSLSAHKQRWRDGESQLLYTRWGKRICKICVFFILAERRMMLHFSFIKLAG